VLHGDLISRPSNALSFFNSIPP